MNTTVTNSPTINGTTGPWAAVTTGFKAATCASASVRHGLLLTGVGN